MTASPSPKHRVFTLVLLVPSLSNTGTPLVSPTCTAAIASVAASSRGVSVTSPDGAYFLLSCAGWIQPPTNENLAGQVELPVEGNSSFCQDSPCLFDIFADPTEHNDIAAQNPAIVAKMSARIMELLQGEVTVKESGLCPTPTGTGNDQKSAASARAIGFWEPWLPPINTSG